MNEPLTIAQVRKPVTLKVPAGGWIILVQPDRPYGEHAAARQAIAREGLVNEEYAAVRMGKLRQTVVDLRLVTAEEQKAAQAEAARNEAALKKSVEDAAVRTKAQAEASAEADAKAHAKRVAEVSAQNDAIRNRK